MKKLFTIIIISTGLLIAVISIVVIVFFNKDQNSSNTPVVPLPTKHPVFQDKVIRKNVPYNTEAQRKLSQIIRERPTLSSQGAQLRQEVIGYLNNSSGVVHQTDSYRIEYIKSPNVFMTKIKSSNIQQTKQEVSEHLISLGFIPTDICNLPLVFYLNRTVAQQLRESSIEFSPLPLGC
jgi:hypothetical protein